MGSFRHLHQMDGLIPVSQDVAADSVLDAKVAISPTAKP